MIINWKTTLAGLLTGLVPLIQGIAGTLASGGTIDWYPMLLGFGIISLGVLAKDARPTVKPDVTLISVK